ncbi:Sec-independent protein translocase family protein [Microbacterium gorillae]|uniref:hypothetical protein n=1 Tax=Microbacterium gorillae TaxID=1231063 RepID=UPI000694A9C7|nr:hypothetical protein [Microbacterium gorillae]
MDLFGLTFPKLMLILVIGVVLVGPEKLPTYAEGFARLIKRGREVMQGAKERVVDEMGSDFTEEDWRRLDPRQYDPRRIIREALLDDDPVAVSASGPSVALSAPAAPVRPPIERLSAGERPPFDDEAT